MHRFVSRSWSMFGMGALFVGLSACQLLAGIGDYEATGQGGSGGGPGSGGADGGAGGVNVGVSVSNGGNGGGGMGGGGGGQPNNCVVQDHVSGQNTMAAMAKGGPSGTALLGVNSTVSDANPGIGIFLLDPESVPSKEVLKVFSAGPAGTLRLVDLVGDDAVYYILGTYSGMQSVGGEELPLSTGQGFVAKVTSGLVEWAEVLPVEIRPSAITLAIGGGVVVAGWAEDTFTLGNTQITPDKADGILVHYAANGTVVKAAKVGTTGDEKILDIATTSTNYVVTGAVGTMLARRATVGAVSPQLVATGALITAVGDFSEGTSVTIGASDQVFVAGLASGALNISDGAASPEGARDIFVAGFPADLMSTVFVERYGAATEVQDAPSIDAHPFPPTKIVLSATCDGPVVFGSHTITATGPRMCFAELGANGNARWATALGGNANFNSHAIINGTHILAGGTFSGGIDCGLMDRLTSDPDVANDNSYMAIFTTQ